MYGINSKLQLSIILNSKNDFILSSFNKLPNFDSNEEYKIFLPESEQQPDTFGIPSTPPSWDCPHVMPL